MKEVSVAVGVIYYQSLYLLSFRHAKQHQGNRYEFVGGKFEPYETPREALVREIKEEIGIDIATNSHELLGIVRHEYGLDGHQVSHNDRASVKTSDDSKYIKAVSIHAYLIELSNNQFKSLSAIQHGCEGQALTWVTKSSLLDNQYQLPEANVAILDWLRI